MLACWTEREAGMLLLLIHVPSRRITGSTCLNDAGFDEVDMSQLGDHQADSSSSTRRELVPRLSA